MDSVLREGSLTGRSALVTGGGTGIGRATADLLAELGARVAVAGAGELLDETAAAIRAAGGQCLPVVCDVREPEGARELIDKVIAEFGSLDILVNNAGGQFVAPAETISHNGFRAVMRLNLDAVWELRGWRLSRACSRTATARSSAWCSLRAAVSRGCSTPRPPARRWSR